MGGGAPVRLNAGQTEGGRKGRRGVEEGTVACGDNDGTIIISGETELLLHIRMLRARCASQVMPNLWG